jgi:CheY-like chemotaxis protein
MAPCGAHHLGPQMKLSPSKTLTRIWRALPAQLSSVVSEEATLAKPKLSSKWEPQGRRYYAELALVEPRPGKLWMVFALPLAIACAGKLVVRPAGAIRQSIESQSFDGDDLDAMGECVNTFCAAINDAVQAELGADHRVVFRSGSQEPPALEGIGPLHVASARLELGGLARGELQLVVPTDVFDVASTEPRSDEDDDEDDEDEDEDEDEDDEDKDADDDDADASDADAADDAPQKGARKKKKKKRKRDAGDGRRPDREAQDGDRPLLTPEELAAIREATRGGIGRGMTMIVTPRETAHEQWRASLEGLEIEIEFVSDHHQLLAACRTRQIETIVVDADHCASGGLTVLAALRGKAGAPKRRVVVASQPTQRHLVACLGGGASDYVCRPLDTDTLRRVLCVE